MLSFDSFEGEDENSIKGLNQPVEGFSSSKGLYLHLTILNEGQGVIQFIYGFLHTKQDLLEVDKGIYF